MHAFFELCRITRSNVGDLTLLWSNKTAYVGRGKMCCSAHNCGNVLLGFLFGLESTAYHVIIGCPKQSEVSSLPSVVVYADCHIAQDVHRVGFLLYESTYYITTALVVLYHEC